MYPISLIRGLMTVTLLFLCFSLTQAQEALLPVIFKSEGSQISFTVRKELLPVVSHISLQVLTPDAKTIHEQLGAADQPQVWEVKEMSRYTEGDTYLYLGAVILKPLKGDPCVLLGQIWQSGKKLEFRLMAKRPNNLPGLAPVEFYKSLTEITPNNGAAWLFYGLEIVEKHREEYGISPIWLTPPPPPMAAPPPALAGAALKEVSLSKEEQKKIAEEEKHWELERQALLNDLKIARPMFQKAAELAEDCQLKDSAMTYLAAIARELDESEQEKQWLLRRIDSACATSSIKAESYYALGAKQWQCAYDLTSKYANKKATDYFHFRTIANPADKQKLDTCIITAAEFLEKALEADPNFPDAMFYKSLVFREKQKVTANLAERKKLDLEANKASNRGMALMKQLERRK